MYPYNMIPTSPTLKKYAILSSTYQKLKVHISLSLMSISNIYRDSNLRLMILSYGPFISLKVDTLIFLQVVLILLSFLKKSKIMQPTC